ncbi:MAG: hypothetical protein AAB353_07230 [Candidatus Hydrogenedentota bacterium]
MKRLSLDDLHAGNPSELESEGPAMLIVQGKEFALLLDPSLLQDIEDFFEARLAMEELDSAAREGTIPWEEAKRGLDV